MEPMAQAFAYYNFDTTQNQLVYTANQPQAKYFINSDNFKPGFVTPDDSWENRWRAGPNANLIWDQGLPGKGNGAKSLGQELAASEAFASCQVQKVFKTVCYRTPSSAEQATIDSITSHFKSGGYKLKQVFAESAAACMGS